MSHFFPGQHVRAHGAPRVVAQAFPSYVVLTTGQIVPVKAVAFHECASEEGSERGGQLPACISGGYRPRPRGSRASSEQTACFLLAA